MFKKKKIQGREKYVYSNSKTGKTVIRDAKDFKNQKDFKRFILNREYEFNVRGQKAVKYNVYRDAYTVELKKPIKRPYITMFRIVAEYEGLSATSSFARYPQTKERDYNLKQQAIRRLALQMVGQKAYGLPTPPSDDEVEYMQQQMLSEIDEAGVEFTYIYYRAR